MTLPTTIGFEKDYNHDTQYYENENEALKMYSKGDHYPYVNVIAPKGLKAYFSKFEKKKRFNSKTLSSIC